MLSSKVNIGQRDRLLTFIRAVIKTGISRPSTNEDEVDHWELLTYEWAFIKPFQGNEAMIAERLTETHHVIANIRYRDEITTRDRFVLDGRVYEISSIPPSKDRYLSMDIIGNLLDNETWTPPT